MMRYHRAATLAAVLLMPIAARAQSAEQRAQWNRPMAPFRIAGGLGGNVWYVGTAGLSAFLITGPRGHVLIDGGLPESAGLIAANIRTLGFRLHDVKYLLINHSHVDHAGGLAELKRLTGAKLIASRGDHADLAAGRTIGRTDIAGFPPVTVDRVIADGEQVVLGPIVLTALLTPGHTRGATSYRLRTGGRDVLFVSSISVAGQKLAGDPAYPRAAADFRATFAKLRATKADIFLNFHGEGFGLAAKRAALAAGEPDAFVDPTELGRVVDQADAAFRRDLAAVK